jgi:hypothetical protein
MRGRNAAATAATAVAALVVAGCAGPSSDAAGGARERPPVPRQSVPTTPTTAPRPTQSLPPARLALSWRDLYGASVPVAARKVGPRERGSGGFAGWDRSPAGAALAASYFAVVVDPRMPQRLWRDGLEQAQPAPATGRWMRRFAATRSGQPAGPGSGVAMDSGPPPQVWHPPMSVIAISNVNVDAERQHAHMSVWARTDDGSVWRNRRVRVRWQAGDWRLRLPIGQWRTSAPPQDLRPLTAGLPEHRTGMRR